MAKAGVKMVKAAKHVQQCPVCKSPMTAALYIRPVYFDETDSWKFNRRHIKVCKCNQKEVYGS